MSLTELKEQAGHLSPLDQRKLAAYLRVLAHANAFSALEAACRAANQDDALAREVKEWQAFDDAAVSE